MTQREEPAERIVPNGLPVIDRLCDMLLALERRPNGATIRDLTDELALPRSTVYRCLNTLEAHAVVRRSPAGAYTLGPKLLTLAARVEPGVEDDPFALFVAPYLERLSAATGEASKVSVRDGDGALVIAVAQGTRGYGLTVLPGQSFPLHAGGASKLLLAHMPEPEIERMLRQTFNALTRRTVTDPARLRRELATIRRRDWAMDRGEYSTSVHAIAAPIRDAAGNVIAALSVPFLADRGAVQRAQIRTAVIETAASISAGLAARAATPAPHDPRRHAGGPPDRPPPARVA